MSDINKIADGNIRVLIGSRELKNSWVIERTGIGKNAFYDMLDGKGNIYVHVTKFNKFLILMILCTFLKLIMTILSLKNH